MKRITLIVLSVFITISIFSQTTEKRTQYYPYSHILASEYHVIKNTNTKHGVSKVYYKTGKASEISNYKNGKLHGTYKAFYEKADGVQCLRQYDNGNVTEETWYFTNGKKSRYKKIDGVWKKWYENGALMMEAHLNPEAKWRATNEPVTLEPYMLWYYQFLSNTGSTMVKAKKFTFYYPNGIVSLTNEFGENGFSKKLIEYDEKGETVYERSNVTADIYTAKSYAIEKIVLLENFKLVKGGYSGNDYELVEHGKTIKYNEDGNVIIEYEYKNGFKYGNWKRFCDADFNEVNDSSKASFYRIINYGENEKPFGIVTDFYITGEKQGECFLLSENPDVPLGKFLVYYKNGKLKEESYYNDKGEVEGVVKLYYENGTQSEQWLVENNIKKEIIKWYSNGDKGVEAKYIYEEGEAMSGAYKPARELHKLRYYYENGQPKSYGTQLANDAAWKINEWYFFDKNGSLIRIEYYRPDGAGGVAYKKESGEEISDDRKKELELAANLSEEEFLMIKKEKEILKGKQDKVKTLYVVLNPLFDPNTPVYKTLKKKLYNAYILLDDHLTKEIETTEDLNKKIEASQELVKICDVMILLIDKKTKELEKSLKSETNPEKIRELILSF